MAISSAAAVALLIAAAWLMGNFGKLNRRSPQRVAAPSGQPASPEVPIVNIMDLPVEPRRPPLSGTQNYLIAGVDRRPGGEGGGLTDTLIVIVIEKRTGNVGLISIPRDTAVEIPKHGINRINAAYGLAYSRGDNALEALKQSVSDLIALPIEHAIVVDLNVFEHLVDALGGVTVDVPCPIIDDFIDSRTPSGRRVLDVKAGNVRMDGATAAMYVRSRHGRSDFGRTRRQQAVLAAIHREALAIGTLGHVIEVWNALERNIATDFKRYELLDLARRALGLKLEHLHGLVLTDAQVEPRFDHGRALLFPKLDAIDEAIGGLFSASVPGAPEHGAVCPPADIALQKGHSNRGSSLLDGGVDAGPIEPVP